MEATTRDRQPTSNASPPLHLRPAQRSVAQYLAHVTREDEHTVWKVTKAHPQCAVAMKVGGDSGKPSPARQRRRVVSSASSLPLLVIVSTTGKRHSPTRSHGRRLARHQVAPVSAETRALGREKRRLLGSRDAKRFEGQQSSHALQVRARPLGRVSCPGDEYLCIPAGLVAGFDEALICNPGAVVHNPSRALVRARTHSRREGALRKLLYRSSLENECRRNHGRGTPRG
jgi:hypothetical protein